MIELPDSPAPNGVTATLLDFALVQRPASGAALQVIDRPGSRFQLEYGFPVMKADTARKFTVRLTKAKREGLRIGVPLLGVSQGIPGAPVVDGAGQSGTTLDVRGLTANYAFKEGFWMTVIDADGEGYLHQISAPGAADALGDAAISIEPALRAPFADGDEIELANPWVAGVVTSQVSWPMELGNFVRLGFTLEEAA